MKLMMLIVLNFWIVPEGGGWIYGADWRSKATRGREDVGRRTRGTRAEVLVGLFADKRKRRKGWRTFWRASASSSQQNRELAGTPSCLHVAFMLNCQCCFFLFILCENDRRVRVFWAPAPDGRMGLESLCRTWELCSNRLIHARNKKSGDWRWIKTLLKDAWWHSASDLVSNQTQKLNSVNDRKKTRFSRAMETGKKESKLYLRMLKEN